MALLESKVPARAALLFMVITTSMVLNLSPSTFVQAIGVQGMSTIIHIAFMDIGLLILTKVFFSSSHFAVVCNNMPMCTLGNCQQHCISLGYTKFTAWDIIARRVQLSVAAQLM